MDENTESDKGFLDLLHSLRGWAATANRVYYPIHESSLSTFFSVEEAKQRLTRIADRKENIQLAERAKDLLESIVER